MERSVEPSVVSGKHERRDRLAANGRIFGGHASMELASDWLPLHCTETASKGKYCGNGRLEARRLVSVLQLRSISRRDLDMQSCGAASDSFTANAADP